MRLAFLTGAVASGFAVAGLAALVVWVVTVFSGSTEPWSIAPPLVAGVAVVTAVGTYLAERVVYRRTMAGMRETGEPWAYRR